MPSTSTKEILDSITTSCTAVHPDVFPIPVAPAGILPSHNAACVAVARARTVDEVQVIASNAEALRAYAWQARNRQLELDAAEIRIRAERRLGELMQGAARTIGMAKPPGANQYKDRVATKPEAPPTLAEAGIDKNLAHRARSLAAVPAEKFEELLHEKRHRGNPRVVLAAELRAEADAAPGIEPPDAGGRGELIAPAAKGLAAENAVLRRRVAALAEENSELKDLVKMWKARARQAGWMEPADASSGGG